MKKNFIVFMIVVFGLQLSAFADDNTIENGKDKIIKSNLFSIVMPKELNGSYFITKGKNKISVYDKASKKSGFGGFVFGIKAYKNPAHHAVLPGGKKIGELLDKKGNLYDIVLKYPTDVQYDYTKYSKMPDSYKKLYDMGKVANIQASKGSTYYKWQGTKGEELYKEVLQKHVKAIDEKWDSIKLEKENMSYMYNIINSGGKGMNKVGYAYYDVNCDGIDELFIGEIASGEWKGIVYDIYTMVNRKPVHVVSGGSRDRYFICDDAFICNEYSSGALESGLTVYALVENSIEMFPQVSFKYDGYKNPKMPWFISYGSEINEDEWDNISEKMFNERKKIFERYKRFDYIPLAEVKF